MQQVQNNKHNSEARRNLEYNLFDKGKPCGCLIRYNSAVVMWCVIVTGCQLSELGLYNFY